MNKKLKAEFVLPFCFCLIGFAVLLNSCSKKDETNPNVLAVVGDKIISKENFIIRYQKAKAQNMSGLPDNGQIRRQLLEHMIHEELLIMEARKYGFDKDEAGRLEQQRIEIQESLNAYIQKFIKDRITISDEELKSLYVRLNTKIKARHLYAPTKKMADSLYNALTDGASFERLADIYFSDPVLRESGGSLGYFTVDEMEPAFEDAAFSLKTGEISKPVRTPDGYSIIKIDDRIVRPLLIENEYLQHRSKLEAYWLKRKSMKATKQLTDSLQIALHISFHKPIVEKIFEAVKNSPEVLRLEKQINDLGDLKNEILLTSEIGEWTVGKFQEAARFTSKNQKKWIRNIENLEDFISGLVVRSYILSKSKKEKLDKTLDYKENVRYNFDNYLLTCMEEKLREEMEVPEDSLKLYYQDDPSLFSIPPKIRLKEIVVRDTKTAEKVSALLMKGSDFSELAKQYSIRRRIAHNGGDLGYLTPPDLGKWAKLAFSMSENQWIGPVKMDSNVVFLKCEEKIEGKVRDFNEARFDVEQTVAELLWPDYLKKQIMAIRQNAEVRSFPSKLRDIQIN